MNAQEFGYLKAEVNLLKEMVAEMRTDLKIMKERDDKREGGLKVLIGLAAIVGGVASTVVSWIIAHVKLGGPT